MAHYKIGFIKKLRECLLKVFFTSTSLTHLLNEHTQHNNVVHRLAWT
jgi:hypothetical protein